MAFGTKLVTAPIARIAIKRWHWSSCFILSKVGYAGIVRTFISVLIQKTSEPIMSKTKHNLYGWSPACDADIRLVYEHLKTQGFDLSRNGEPNVSATLLYLLNREARAIERESS